LIRRTLCAGFTIVALILAPAAAPAASSSTVTGVAWHRDGVVTWEGVTERAIAPQTLHRFTSSLAVGQVKVIAPGRPGRREVRRLYAQRGGGPVHSTLLSSRVVSATKSRVVAEGIGSSPLGEFEARGISRMTYVAREAIQMVATAYTADCAGCGGTTATGRRAGHGIVAVDPRVIPLGTHLYIPGYGIAVAGDTGGAIVGDRIDLGFDSLREALLFGRRSITVYRLK